MINQDGIGVGAARRDLQDFFQRLRQFVWVHGHVIRRVVKASLGFFSLPDEQRSCPGVSYAEAQEQDPIPRLERVTPGRIFEDQWDR